MKIKPCPFCGNKPKLVLHEGWWYLRCITDTHIASSLGKPWLIKDNDINGLKYRKWCIQQCIIDWNTRG